MFFGILIFDIELFRKNDVVGIICLGSKSIMRNVIKTMVL